MPNEEELVLYSGVLKWSTVKLLSYRYSMSESLRDISNHFFSIKLVKYFAMWGRPHNTTICDQLS